MVVSGWCGRRLCPRVGAGHHLWVVLTGCGRFWAVAVDSVVCFRWWKPIVVGALSSMVAVWLVGGLVAWRSHVVVVLVGVGCERTAGSLVAVGSGGDVVALSTMVVVVVVVVVGRQTMCIVCLLFVVPNRTSVFAENRPRPYRLIIID